MREFSRNSPERGPEKILTSEEVLHALSRYAEGFTVGRELSDEKGVYLREVTVPGEKEGNFTEYQYKRKVGHGTNRSTITSINAIYYQNGIPLSGDTVSVFNEETGQWEDR
jgi:hypothetical protein